MGSRAEGSGEGAIEDVVGLGESRHWRRRGFGVRD